MEPIIELKNVTKKFGGITALDNASLHVDKGEVVGLIGDNGAGKSTLIKTLVGVHKPDNGDIIIKGQKVNNGTQKSKGSKNRNCISRSRINATTIDCMEYIYGKRIKTPLRIYKS